MGTPHGRRIWRRGGQTEAEEHKAGGELAGWRRGELQGGGVVPWRLRSLEKTKIRNREKKVKRKAEREKTYPFDHEDMMVKLKN